MHLTSNTCLIDILNDAENPIAAELGVEPADDDVRQPGRRPAGQRGRAALVLAGSGELLLDQSMGRQGADGPWTCCHLTAPCPTRLVDLKTPFPTRLVDQRQPNNAGHRPLGSRCSATWSSLCSSRSNGSSTARFSSAAGRRPSAAGAAPPAPMESK